MSPSAGGGAGPLDQGGRLAIVQVVRSDGFAGVERYITEVSASLSSRGHRIAVVGGDPARMASELPSGVSHRPARTVAGTSAALLHHRDVDLVHAHMTAAETAAWLVRPVLRAPIVATRHFAADRGSSAAARLLAGRTSRSVARDIAISRYVAGGVTGPTLLLANGVPERPQAPLTASTVVLLQRLSPEKQPGVALEAWRRSRLGERGWRLVVAGSGELAADLARLAGQLGVAESVEFAGRVGDTDALLSGSSILLATAPAEPFGLSVVEAMAHGLPVVAAGGGGHLETMGDAGFLFPPGDAAAAASALVELADSPERRLRTGAALRRRQQELYSLTRHVDRLEEVYREVVADARGRGSTPR